MAQKGATIADLRNQALLGLIGDRCYGKAGLAIDVAPADVETTAAVDFSIDGVMYTLAAQAAIDLSALAKVDEEGATVDLTAQATGTDRAYLLVVNAAGTLKVVQGTAVAAGETVRPPQCPTSHAPIGVIKVENASGSDFTLGTTSLAAAGVTDTYVDVAVVPASV